MSFYILVWLCSEEGANVVCVCHLSLRLQLARLSAPCLHGAPCTDSCLNTHTSCMYSMVRNDILAYAQTHPKQLQHGRGPGPAGTSEVSWELTTPSAATVPKTRSKQQCDFIFDNHEVKALRKTGIVHGCECWLPAPTTQRGAPAVSFSRRSRMRDNTQRSCAYAAGTCG